MSIDEASIAYIEERKKLKEKPLGKIQFEVDVTEHYNLNCKWCSQFSSIAEPFFIDINEMKMKIYTEMGDRAGNLSNDSGKLDSFHHEGMRIKCSRTPSLNHNVLLPDGTVVLCCNDFGLDYVLGNLNNDTYDSLMKSDTMRTVKRKMNIDLNDNLICRECMYGQEI